MSKSITIQEGGVGKTLTNVKKLKTAKQGGGSVFWVPEEEVRLTTKHISKNGTYKASSDNAYGYSQVTVSGIGKATGIKPGSGTPISEGGNGKDNEYAFVTPQGGGGSGGSDDNIIEKLLPSSIKIITPPSQTEYTDGEDISISGMVVTAYNNDGTVWTDQDHPSGHVALSELTFEPTKADIDKSSDTTWSDGHGLNAVEAHYEESKYKMINGFYPSSRVYTENVYKKILGKRDDYYVTLRGGDEENGDGFLLTRYNGKLYGKSMSKGYLYEDMCAIHSSPHIDGDGVTTYEAITDDYIYMFNGGTSGRMTNRGFSALPWGEYMNGQYIEKIPESTVDPANFDGELTPHSGGQEVTVTWKRPEDEKELSDKFSITVNPDVSGGGGTDSGGGSW